MTGMKSIRLPGFRHQFEVTGLNLERFLNTVNRCGIPLIHISRCAGKTLRCECWSADLPMLRSIAEDKGWRFDMAKPLGLSAALNWLKRRPGVPAGIAAALAALFVLSQYVWLVEINGAGAYHSEVSQWLSQNGYGPGTRLSYVDASRVEEALTYRYPDIAWFHVYVSGVRMVVDVTQGKPLPQELPQETGSLVAKQGGIVQSIQVHAGTAAAKAGDVVQKGQVLIHGMERGSDGAQLPVRAEGVVMARCWDSHTVEMPILEVLSQETGRSFLTGRVSTPWFCWPAQPQTADFLAFNTYVHHMPIGGVFFPLVWQRIEQREVMLEYAPRSVEQVRAEAAQAALKHLKSRHFGDEIIDKWVDYCMIEGDTLAATATVEWLMDIGSPELP